jgi:hypothetical protein
MARSTCESFKRSNWSFLGYPWLSKPFLNQPFQGYYGPLYTDVESETEAARASYREYFIIFEPQAQDGASDVSGFINPINYI